jgi:hypothetical protein
MSKRVQNHMKDFIVPVNAAEVILRKLLRLNAQWRKSGFALEFVGTITNLKTGTTVQVRQGNPTLPQNVTSDAWRKWAQQQIDAFKKSNSTRKAAI